MLGVYPVQVDLHPEVSINVTANVARTQEEADIQAKTGRAVLGEDEQDAIDLQEAANAEAIFDEGVAPELSEDSEETVEDASESADVELEVASEETDEENKDA